MVKRKLTEEFIDEECVPKKAKKIKLKDKKKWTNRQRVMVLASRGILYQHRHLMQDLHNMLPHSKKESKMEKKDTRFVANEVCEMKNCSRCIYFEGKKTDLYMWLSSVPQGPSAKFLVENIHTAGELKMTGNCLKGSRPLLSFGQNFKLPHWAVIKELLVQIFGVPEYHPRSQPFFDHVLTFSVLDNKVWFRNYQILEENGALNEIGPRFVLNPIKIFSSSFGGETVWENSKYVSPNVYRILMKKSNSYKYLDKVHQKLAHDSRRPTGSTYQLNPTDDVFSDSPKLHK